MPAPYKHEVERFIQHFRTEADKLRQPGLPLHKKILYATALDPLARAAYGSGGGHRARLTRLIRELSGWSDAERVSLAQLRERLRDLGLYRRKLYRSVSERLHALEDGLRVGLQRSPFQTELLPLAQPDEIHVIADCRYSELFYTYRNALVHEFREPGYGWDISGTSMRPFYMSYLNKRAWELVYPVLFFERMLDSTLDGLRAHLLQGRIDPYKRFQFGTMWKSK